MDLTNNVYINPYKGLYGNKKSAKTLFDMGRGYLNISTVSLRTRVEKVEK